MFFQTSNHENLVARTKFVEDSITKILLEAPKSDFLDLGAGLSPFKSAIESQGGKYFSQDFSSYVPSVGELGLQNTDWTYPNHDYICRISDFKPGRSFNNLLCTEVLEHVENPIDVIRVISEIVETNGRVIITVPMLSLVHQAPHFYSSGLSIYWFRKWLPFFGLRIDEIVISGDFADLLNQEISRGISQMPRMWRNRLIIGLKDSFIKQVRKHSEDSILQSGGFGIFVFATKV